MKFLIIDDEHELYKIMYADLLNKNTKYDVEEVPKFVTLPGILKFVNNLHFNDKINRHIWIPFKKIWNRFYYLNKIKFDSKEEYWIVFLNGTLRNFYSIDYLNKFKKKHSNVRLALVMYDSSTNSSASRAFKMLTCFDKIISFDERDCKNYGFEHIFSTLSFPNFLNKDKDYQSDVFFVGSSVGRERLLFDVVEKIMTQVKNPSFFITGVNEKKEGLPIKYNQSISYSEALLRSYNTDCILEIVKPGQTGITLRTCEAILFNKKLLTNNTSLLDMPFYNEKFMSVFKNVDELDLNFLSKKIDVKYNYKGEFSPERVLESLNKGEN
ncbi:hypothetical protein [Streptococcus lutetiensis]|uniref:hypothetical protein n=2 Tax=Streptococcus lutetiensis TaxID=150055 RepID=UPI001BD98D4F|nr:hypothetical protein [Streptococcus lutetiensis]MBT0914210.1 hypothetical protein [Streptococcus lutetiensis]MBT0915900.1 hypothetical protein [Streptococcus lutetiensis]MBT0919315.1 hypothetical protein [Streptococcus lutetiensis]MBT1049599.1 hypothetical protein [Streptococcus lutetiensis]